MSDINNQEEKEQQQEQEESPSSKNETNNNDKDPSTSESKEEETSASASFMTIDPYAVLNVAPNATADEIQKSYKFLSRSFHPDKQPPGRNRDIAQNYFVQFKSSYDIIIDPVLRLAYDNHGMEGVRFLLKNPKIYKSMEQHLAQIDNLNQNQNQNQHKKATSNVTHSSSRRQAREILAEALQYHSFYTNTRFHKPSTSAEITVNCNSTHSAFLGESPLSQANPIEVEDTRLSMSITKSPGAKTSLSFGGHSSVSSGQGSSGAQISVNYEPSQGTDVHFDLDVGTTPDATKLTLGTSRVLSNQTYVAATFSTSPPSSSKDVQVTPIGMTLTSHRSMINNHITGTWVMGLALPKFQLQYGLLSFTSLYPNQPKYTAKFNIGMDYTPVQFSAEKSFGEEDKHVGKISWGWGPRGIDLKAVSQRYLSQYCKLNIGLHHISAKGLTWWFQIQRGSIKFTVPILITTVMSPAYAVKSLYVTLVTGLVDAALGDLVKRGVEETMKEGAASAGNRASLRREEVLLEREKVKRDALLQIRLMEKPAQAKRLYEEKHDGLVIVNAVYSVVGGDSIDVTTAIMFWVVKGRLQLPSTTKSSMLGFYDLRHEAPVDCEVGYIEACWKVLEKMWNGEEKAEVGGTVAIPTLNVRYRYAGCLYEITASDHEPLSLPSPNALQLGGARVN